MAAAKVAVSGNDGTTAATHVLPTYARAEIVFERGEGVQLFTVDGTRYLDFAGGVAVSALGHAHPHLVKALAEQAGKVWHTSNLYRIAGQERLADRLAAATFADVAFFCNSGAEALECSIKMARRYHYSGGAPERYRVITFDGAFHGRTLATIAAGNNKKHLEGFGPAVDGFDPLPALDLGLVEKAIGPKTAGILIEPIQGEGGIRVVLKEFLAGLRKLADKHGILLMLDEVQCGIGRTGKLFAHEWAGITPDIMGIAKGIGGGFPLGACLATSKAARGMTAGTHGSTFGGNPLASAVGNAVLDVVLEPGFLANVEARGKSFRHQLESIQQAHPRVIEDVRGSGLMLGLKVTPPLGDVIARMREEKLLSVPAGDNVIRLLPPLIVTEADIAEACGAINRSVAHFEMAASA